MWPGSAFWNLPKNLYYIAMNDCKICNSIMKSMQEHAHFKEGRNQSSLKNKNKIQSWSSTLWHKFLFSMS